MNKEELLLILTKEFNVLYELRAEQIDRELDYEKEKKEESYFPDPNKFMKITFDKIETRARIKELQTICKLLEIDWKIVRMEAFKND